MNSCSVGVDIGGSKICVVTMSESGKVIKEFSFPTKVLSNPKPVIHDIVEHIKKLKLNLHSIGIGVAGQVDTSTGLVHFGPNLDWHNVSLGTLFENEFKVTVKVFNDVRAGTYAEWKFGAGKNAKDMVCLLIGTGIGGGIVSGNHLLTGASNTAGELGHIIVNLDGPACTCGSSGCMEALASGWALAKQAQQAGAEAHWKTNRVTGATVIEKYRQGDPIALEVINNAKKALIAGATSIVNALNPERFIIGGGIVEGIPEIIDWIDQGVREHALAAALEPLTVLPCRFGKNGVAIGAASYAAQKADAHEVSN